MDCLFSKNWIELPPNATLSQIHLVGYCFPQSHATQAQNERQSVQILRAVIAFYSHCSLDEVILDRLDNGKPVLRNPPGDLWFNLSHAHSHLLMAFSQETPVGIDIEFPRGIRHFSDTLAYAFAPTECREILALPENVQLDSFFACWVRKEAYIKCLGGTVAQNMDRFEVPTSPGPLSFVIPIIDLPDGGDRVPETLRLQDIFLNGGAKACVCFANIDIEPKQYHLSDLRLSQIYEIVGTGKR